MRGRRQHAVGGTLRIDVVAAGFEVSGDLRRSVERRLLYALSRFGAGVERVAVRLSDEANPLGGFDRRCRMRAWLRRAEAVQVETMDGSLAIPRAVERLAERVEWALIDGRAETELRLMPESPPGRLREQVRSESPPANRNRRIAPGLPAPRRKARKRGARGRD